jgi:hypothetical protein
VRSIAAAAVAGTSLLAACADPGVEPEPEVASFQTIEDCFVVTTGVWQLRGPIPAGHCYFDNDSPLSWQSTFSFAVVPNAEGEDVIVATDTLAGSSSRVREKPTLRFAAGHCYVEGAVVDINDALMSFEFDVETPHAAIVHVAHRNGAFCDDVLTLTASR